MTNLILSVYLDYQNDLIHNFFFDSSNTVYNLNFGYDNLVLVFLTLTFFVGDT
jgi:hypothetical protein